LVYSEALPFNEETKGLYRKIMAVFEPMSPLLFPAAGGEMGRRFKKDKLSDEELLLECSCLRILREKREGQLEDMEQSGIAAKTSSDDGFNQGNTVFDCIIVKPQLFGHGFHISLTFQIQDRCMQIIQSIRFIIGF